MIAGSYLILIRLNNLSGWLAGARIALRNAVIVDVDGRFDKLSEGHHQSPVNRQFKLLVLLMSCLKAVYR